MRRYRNVICTFILILVLLSGCGGRVKDIPIPSSTPEPSPKATPLQAEFRPDMSRVDNVFTLNYKAQAGLNPYSCTDKDNLLLCQLIFEPLFQVKSDFSYEPVLVESYSGDGINFEFKIRSDITFHDGSPISVWDAMYSVITARDSKRYQGRFKSIRDVWVEGGNLRISLSQANTDFPLLLDIPVIRDGAAYTDYPAGTGPYLLGEYEGTIFLEAFKGHRDYDRLPINRIYLKEHSVEELVTAYEEAFIDLVTADPFEAGEPDFGGNSELRKLDTTVLHYLGVNGKSEFLSSDPKRRRLIASMLNRSELAGKYIGGIEALLPVNPASAYYFKDIASGSVYKDIPAALIDSLTEDYDGDGKLEYVDSGEVKDFSLSLVVCNEDPAKLLTARAIAKQLESYGIDVRLRELTRNKFFDALYLGDYDLYYAEIRLKADFDLSELLSYGGTASYGLTDGEIGGKIRAFLAASGEDKITAAHSLYSYLAATCPLIPIAFEQLNLYTHRGAVTGLSPLASNVFYKITEWKITLH